MFCNLRLNLIALMLTITLPSLAATDQSWKPAGYAEIQQAYANQATLHAFYEAFARHDAAAMAKLYHPQVAFNDPVFGTLKGKEASAMWAMLLEASDDLKVVHAQVSATPTTGSAHWDAWYPFSLTGNRVHNKIDAQFEFKDGLIYRHTDSFDLHRWSSMALGPIGDILGGTPIVQGAVQKQARQRLDDYLQRH